MIEERRWRIGALAGLGILVVALFWRTLLGGQVFFERDILVFFVPQAEAIVRAISSGAWPLWDASPAFGQPLTNPDTELFYPLTWLNLFFKPWTYYTLFVVCHSLFSAFGLFLLARSWDMNPSAAFLASSLWILSGPFLSLVSLWHHFAGAAWIPWVLLALERALERPSLRREILFGAAFSGQILAGSADMCAMTLLLALARVVQAVPSLGWRSALRAVGIGLFFASAVTLPSWGPSLELLLQGGRRAFSESFRTYWSVHPINLLELIVPNLFWGLPLSPRLSALLFESREPFLKSLYLGLPTLGLAGLALSVPRSRAPRSVLLFSGLLFALAALGKHFVAYGFLSFLLPPLRILRYPVKAAVPLAFCASCLAGLGFHALVMKTRRSVYGLLPLILLLLVSGAGAFMASTRAWARAFFDPALPQVLSAQASTIVLWHFVEEGVLGLLLLLLFRGGKWAPLAFVLAIGAVFARNVGLNPTAPRALYLYRPELLQTLAGAQRIYVYDYHQTEKARSHLGREQAYALGAAPQGWDLTSAGALAYESYLVPPTAGRFGLRSGFDIDYRGLEERDHARTTALLLESEGTPLHTRLLELGGITHVVALHEVEGLIPMAVLPGLFRDPIRVFRVPHPLPRTYAVGEAVRVEGDALPPLLDPGFDPRVAIVLQGDAPAPPPSPFSGVSQIVEERSDQVVLKAQLSRPGYVVLLDSFGRGWRGFVDGQATTVYRANGLFRAVFVPAGEHRIEFGYRPRALGIGLAVSVVVIGWGFWVGGRRGVYL